MAAKALRVPVAAAYNTRLSTTNSVAGSSAFAGIAIAGIAIAGATGSSSTKDGRMVNCFSETVSDPITGQRKIYCAKRPGWVSSTTPSAGNIGTAIRVWTGQGTGQKVISAFGVTNSTIYDGTTSKGAITGKATAITETLISNNATLVVSSTDNTAWYYDAGATVAVMTKITDVDFPGNAGLTLAGTFAHMDGYAAIMDTNGTIWASDLNSVTSWTATSFASTNSYPDKGIGCIRYKQYILGFGAESMQVFYNNGSTPFPFFCSTNQTTRVGCISADAMTSVSDTVFWCGSTPQGGLSIFNFNGAVQKVSTAEIDAILLIVGAASITLTSVRFFGRSFVICIAGTRTLVYCIEESAWHEWQSATSILWYKCAAVSVGSTMVNYCLSNISTSGKVYTINQASLSYTDDGFAYTATAQMQLMDFDSKNRKCWDSVEIVADRETTTSPLTIAYSDDDYQTYSTWGTVDLSTARPVARRLGNSRRRAWSLSHSANTPMRIEALEIHARIGQS